jgi:multiple sugar transport system substrate-binding protein
MELLYAAGGDVLSADGRTAELDGPAGRRAPGLMRKGVRTGAAPRAVTEYREEAARTRFERGRASFMRNWPYAITLLDVRGSPVAGRFEVAALPPFAGQKPSGVVGGYDLISAERSGNPEAALALIDYLTRDAAVERAAIRYGRIPALATTYGVGTFVDAFDYSPELEQALMQARARPVTPAYPAISFAIRRHVSAALAGRETVAVALRRADREINRALAVAQGGSGGDPA